MITEMSMLEPPDSETAGLEELTPLERELADVTARSLIPRGRRWVRYFKDVCELEPDESVLDVGSGNGRVAIPLTALLAPEGRYEGFDIVPAKVKWCADHITPRYPNFRFQLANVVNSRYNPEGIRRASEYTFPFPDHEFDFVFVVTVFSYMLPAEVEHYLFEAARVMRPRGRLLASFLLLNGDSLRLLEAEDHRRYDPAPNSNDARFSHDFGDYRVTNEDMPEALVAHREELVLEVYKKVGLRLRQPIDYGRWPGRQVDALNADIIVADLAR
jgi:SAM-dependent methyltransferase